MLNGLDLFSGIGGLTLALKPWVRPILYCENDRYAQAVLLSRMWSGDIGRAAIWDDVRSLGGKMLDVPIDIIYGGFPCQDISAAGLGIGLGGERSGLFQHIARLVQETNPRFVFLENVPAIRTRGLNSVVQTFTEFGYDCRWTIVSAAEVGAPHLRKRWFMLAHAMRERGGLQQGRRERSSRQGEAVTLDDGARQPVAHAQGERLEGQLRKQRGLRESDSETQGQGSEQRDLSFGCGEVLAHASGDGRLERRAESAWIEGRSSSAGGGSSMGDAASERLSHGPDESLGQPKPLAQFERPDWWSTEPDVGRVVNGLPFRVDRLRGLGNAVVPRQAQVAFKRLMGLND